MSSSPSEKLEESSIKSVSTVDIIQILLEPVGIYSAGSALHPASFINGSGTMQSINVKTKQSYNHFLSEKLAYAINKNK